MAYYAIFHHFNAIFFHFSTPFFFLLHFQNEGSTVIVQRFAVRLVSCELTSSFHHQLQQDFVSCHLGYHERHFSFAWAERTDSGDLSNVRRSLNVIKATPGLIFKHWELVMELCASRANYQAVIKTAF